MGTTLHATDIIVLRPMLTATILTYRNAYRGLSRSTWLLSLVMLINRSGTMVIPFMTLYLTSPAMGYSIGEAGFVFGLFGAGAFAGAWCGGRLTDKIGFYPVQVITLTGGGLLFIVLGQMNTFPLICLFTFLVSFVNEAFRPANSTAIAFYSNSENRTRSYALNRLAINLGWAVGSSIGGIIARFDYHLLFWVDGITNVGAAIIMLVCIKRIDHHVKDTDSEPGTTSKASSAYADKKYLSFIGVTILFAACFFQIFTNLPVYFKRDLHLSEPFIGFLMAINGIIIALVEMALVYRLEGKRRNVVFIRMGVALCGISFLLLHLPLPAIIAALVMIISMTFGEILAMPFMNSFWIARSRPSNRGQYAALYTMAWSLAQTLGPVGGSQLAQHLGFDFLWWIVGALCILAAIAFSKFTN